MASLKRKLVEGAAWMIGMRLVVNLLGFVSTVFLARLLTPADFGIVALAGSAYAFFSVLGQFGFDSALIHYKDPSVEHYNTAWTANILVGLSISAMMFVVAKPAAWFFEDARIEYVVYAFSLLSFAKGFENIGVVNFRKSLQFRGDFLYFVIPKIPSVVVAVSAAFVLRNYWALVIGMITSQVVTLLYSHFSQPFRPRLSLSKFGDLFGYSRWILLTNCLEYLSNNGVEVFLGRMKDAAAVGIYGIAKQLAYLPSNELLAPVNRALFPGFASVSDDPARLRNILSRVLAITALVSIPSAFGILALANSLVLVIFGEQWREVAPVLSVLGIAGVIAALRSALGPILLARGNPRVITTANVVLLLVTLPTVIVLVPKIGIVGVAYAGLAGSIITMPILLTAVRRDIGFGWWALASCVWRPVIASVLMAAAVYHAQLAILVSEPVGPLVLIELVAIGVVVFSVALLAIWAASGFPAGAEKVVLEQIYKRLGAKERLNR